MFSPYFVMKPWCCFPCSIISLYILHFKSCTITAATFATTTAAATTTNNNDDDAFYF